MGDFFRNLEKACAYFKKKQYWREATMGDVGQKFEQGMREFPKRILAGGKLWGHFSRNLETVCANFQETLLDYWPEEIMGEFFQKFGDGMREFPTLYWPEETTEDIVPEI